MLTCSRHFATHQQYRAVHVASSSCCVQARTKVDRWVCCATKRQFLQTSIAVGLLSSESLRSSLAEAQEQQEVQQQQQQQLPDALRVGAKRQLQSIQQAIDAAAPGATILIDPGMYTERLTVDKSLVLAAADKGSRVEVAVNTTEPYQHCLTVQQPSSSSSSGSGEAAAAASVVMQHLTFSHYSKSVADNYAVFVQSGTLLLQQCDISSSSGVGVCVQGAELQLEDCSVHDCVGHGVAVYGALEGGVGKCTLQRSSIISNKLNGVLARDGAELNMTGCSVQGNGGYGVQLQDCAAQLSGSSLLGNKAGPAAVQLGSVDGDLKQLEQANTLEGIIQLL